MGMHTTAQLLQTTSFYNLLKKRWPEKQDTLLLELNRLVKRYRLAEALTLLNNE